MFGPFSIVGDASITPTEYAEASFCQPAVYQTRLAIARTLAGVRLHRLEPADAGWQRKRRRRWASGLVRAGNAYLRSQGVSVRILPLQEWLEWERQVAGALGRDSRISPDGSALDRPFIVGSSLSEILRGHLPWEDKLSALQAAAGALARLHSKWIHSLDGAAWELSHGDATCHNVIVNLSTASAEWIDFDMRHERSLPAVEQHADDLRALLFSSAACLPAGLQVMSAERTLAGYGDPAVVRQLRRSLERPHCPAVFHLAQGPVSYAEYWRLWRSLRGDHRGTVTSGFSALSASLSTSVGPHAIAPQPPRSLASP